MGFDLVIFDKKDNRAGHVRIEAGEHHRLMKMAKQLKLSVINRMWDYYADAHFTRDELSALEEELKLLQNCAKEESKEGFLYINEFLQLVSHAKTIGTDILGIAD